MKFTTVSSLSGREILARDVLYKDGTVLLKKSTRMREAFKQQLLVNGIEKIYIEDGMKDPHTPTQIVSHETRLLLSNELKKQFDIVRNKISVNPEILNDISNILLEDVPTTPAAYDLLDIRVNDTITYEHSICVAILTALVCKQLNLSHTLSSEITIGALLHDIGKMIIPRDIVNKQSKLTDEEYQIMKDHPTLGYQMIKDYDDISNTSKLIVLNHHEREDGSGYPSGNGAALHIGAKIVGACDILEALITERPYRRAVSLEQALLILRSEKIADEVRIALEQLLEFYPIDTIVLLNTSDIAIVEATHSNDIKRPIVKTIYSLTKNDYVSEKIDLVSCPEVKVVKKLDLNDTIRKVLANQP